jgi:hypothetical protein
MHLCRVARDSAKLWEAAVTLVKIANISGHIAAADLADRVAPPWPLRRQSGISDAWTWS